MPDEETQSPVLDEQKLVNKDKIAYRYAMSPRTIQELMSQGILPFHKIGYMVRFDPEECDRALERFKRVPKMAPRPN